MTTFYYVFLLICCVFLSGCSGTRQTQEDQAPEKEASTMIQIQNFTVTEETLAFDYQVTNPFTYDIRVCQDPSAFGVAQVITCIDDETVRLQLRFNLKRDYSVLPNPPSIAKYLRLAPGESHSDRILLNLPITDTSTVSSFREQELIERKQIVLHRVIFEVGYFGRNLNQLFDEVREQIKDSGSDKGFQIMGGFHYLKTIPLVVDEMQDGRLREFVYTNTFWPHIKDEKSVEAVVSDVDVPCSIGK